MRLLELEIQNVRGIPYLKISPNGSNFVIWGPNGSGKSAVVDAIDFLLTGQISRLMGKGTGGITLSRHGPHIDHSPRDAKVRASVQLPGSTDSVVIERGINDPDTLVCSKDVSERFLPIMMRAKSGQHVLTRRDILRYITADAGTRAQEIQALLNITEVENIRKALGRTKHKLEAECETLFQNLRTAIAEVNATVQSDTFNKDIVLEFANKNREVLGGKPLTTIESKVLKSELHPPTIISTTQDVSPSLLEKDVENLCSVISRENQESVGTTDGQLRGLITNIKSDLDLLRDLSRIELTKLGIELIDATGNCPLCDTSWPPGELYEYLNKKLSTAQVALEKRNSIINLSNKLTQSISNTSASLNRVIKAAQTVDFKDALPLFESWLDSLQGLSAALNTPMKTYPDIRFESSEVQRLLAPSDIVENLTNLQTAVSSEYPKTTPQQSAWDNLTRLEVIFKAYEKALSNSQTAVLSQKRGEILEESFLTARDNVLEKLYSEISGRFTEIYRQLHGEDESQFEAIIESDEAGINFEVDFFGRGKHPPHALHSEGHQDSMGICLYLALNEHLAGGLIDLVILDDVVMSVDANHRREVCNLLANLFSNRQFLITTHDKTWASQLKSAGIVDSKSSIEFFNWKIETGPLVNYEVDIWDRIESCLTKNDVPSAAFLLRRASEEFFALICDSLWARVRYRLDGRWELGDYLPAAIGRYNDLLNKAKAAAQSWGDEEVFQTLQEWDSTAGQIFKRTNVEQWAMNANVHYNNWVNFSSEDFRPVFEAFQDLHGLFICPSCRSILHLTTYGVTPTTVTCNCGKISWNLTSKSKKS